ncbi:MAG TPA: glycerol-3-phosphate dehydrogenase/oxidase, partial [Planctomycetota bacterium]|nr:glycerol-3-phosphate dehydrogenase/oxidase [Planctomycetota bacterium]
VDFLVVGGGIQGAAIARELALRGADVLLVEKHDFAAGTSSRSSRLVHGGVRYLEHLHLGLVREALHEREILLRTAPHWVRPLPMLMPFFRGEGRSRFVLRAGLALYALLAGRSTLPRPVGYSAEDCLRLVPALRRRGLLGGALYHDAVTEDCRLTLGVVAAAHRAGARVANHAEVVGASAAGVRLRDHLFDAEVVVQPRATVNAAGPHVDTVRRALGIDAPPLVRISRGSHLVLPAHAFGGDVHTAIAAFLPDRRIQFVIPHPRGVVCGTTEVDDEARGEWPSVPEDDVRYLLAALQYLLESPPPRAEVRFGYSGWRALPARTGPAGALHREASVVDERGNAGAVHSVVGGKLTTHRAFAERVATRLAGAEGPSRSRHEPLPGGEGPAEPTDPLWLRHGSLAARVRARARGERGLLVPFLSGRDLIGAEVAFAVEEQGAVTFADVMLRRLFQVDGPPLAAADVDAAFALFARFRPAGLPPLDEARERAAFAEQVASTTGALGISVDAAARPRT